MTGLIKREDAIKYCKSKAEHYRKRLARIEAQGDAIGYDPTEQLKGFKDEIAIYESFVKELEDIPSAENKGEWIPVKWHEITDKEREEEDYPEEWTIFIDSPLPADGERILVTTKHGEVEIDTCYEDDGFYLDSGWDWVDDIIAWMPLPKPWEGADNERL